MKVQTCLALLIKTPQRIWRIYVQLFTCTYLSHAFEQNFYDFFFAFRKNIGEGFDSDSQSPKHSDSEEAPKPRKQGRPRKNAAPSKPEAAPVRPVTSRRAKAKVVYEEEDEDEEEEEEEEQEQEEPQPAPRQQKQQKMAARSKQQLGKIGVKQTKMDDFSPKGRGSGGGKTLNGASSTRQMAAVTKTSSQKGAGRGLASHTAVVKRFVTSPPAVSPSRSRMLGAESDDSMSSSKGGDDRPSPAVVRRLKPPMLRENM